MDSILTNISFTPSAFRQMNKCLVCGICRDEKKLCDDCRLQNYKKCIYCECIIHLTPYTSYTYDTKDEKRKEETKTYVNKNLIHEFIIENDANSTEENICTFCEKYKEGKLVKNKCFLCKDYFLNCEKYHKVYGNLCLECIKQFNYFSVDDEKKEIYQEYRKQYYKSHKKCKDGLPKMQKTK